MVENLLYVKIHTKFKNLGKEVHTARAAELIIRAVEDIKDLKFVTRSNVTDKSSMRDLFNSFGINTIQESFNLLKSWVDLKDKFNRSCNPSLFEPAQHEYYANTDNVESKSDYEVNLGVLKEYTKLYADVVKAERLERKNKRSFKVLFADRYSLSKAERYRTGIGKPKKELKDETE